MQIHNPDFSASVIVWKQSAGHFQMVFHGHPNSEWVSQLLKLKTTTLFKIKTALPSKCLSQHIHLFPFKYFWNLFPLFYLDYQNPIQSLISSHLNYWESVGGEGGGREGRGGRTESCPTLCNPTDCSPSGSSVPGILQARILEWVAIPSSRGSSGPRDWTQVSHVAGKFFTV